MTSEQNPSASSRVAIIAGTRTPFVKAGTAFRDLSMQQLGTHVLKELVARHNLDPNQIDEFIFGAVLLDPRTPNWAREIVFAAGLPKTLYALSVSNNCISGLAAISSAAERIALGLTKCSIAGGAESMSKPVLLFNQRATDKFLQLFGAKSFGARAQLLASFRPGDFKPQPPSPTEPSTGLTMGQHMEITAKQLGIDRVAQDTIAFESHRRAAAATEAGLLTAGIAPLAGVAKDTIIRSDTTVEKLAKLKPVFDRSEKGTLTAGNSSPLTDGASAVLLMSEAEAARQNREVLAYITGYEYAAIDPNDGLLMAPAVAVPRMLRRMGLQLSDFDLFEVHEAFGAQVAANIKAWEEGWKEPALGKIDRAKLNVNGGSIAIGHPFAATGGRIVASLAHELARTGKKRGLISICAAGAMAGAMVLERP